MRPRFVVALVLSLPVVAYSSLGTLVLGSRERARCVDGPGVGVYAARRCVGALHACSRWDSS